VVVDKPLAATVEDGRKLAEAARNHDLLAVPYHNRRWDGDFRTVQRIVREGTIGRITRFESRFERWRPIPRPGWRERTDPAEAGGILFDLGSHLIDQAIVLFGPVSRVYAELENRRQGSDVDDDVFLALVHSSGVRSHLWMSAVAAEPGPRLRLLGMGGAYMKMGMDVQEGGLREGLRPDEAGWGQEPEERWGILNDGTTSRRIRTETGGYHHFYAELEAAIRRRGPAPVDIEDAIAGLAVIDAARKSAAEARVVSV
jgi:predicted dehydrogenase